MAIPVDYFTRPIDETGFQRPAPVENDIHTIGAALSKYQDVVSEILDARSRSGLITFTAAQRATLRAAFLSELTNLKVVVSTTLPTP